MSRRSVSQWRRDVFASTDKKMTGSVKVLLLYLADYMSERDRHVSVPRAKIAKALGIHEQRVAERFKSAVDAGFLHPVSRGFIGRTAVYQGTWPDPAETTGERTAPQYALVREQAGERTDSRDALSTPKSVRSRAAAEREKAGERTAPLDAINTADLSESSHGRTDGSSEDGCRFHGFASCPTDCLDHPTNRRTA